MEYMRHQGKIMVPGRSRKDYLAGVFSSLTSTCALNVSKGMNG